MSVRKWQAIADHINLQIVPLLPVNFLGSRRSTPEFRRVPLLALRLSEGLGLTAHKLHDPIGLPGVAAIA